ncbi:hypothetical protein GU942_003377 [Salmonella enterica]|nr:hypothetical protein [Salmonella enterica]
MYGRKRLSLYFMIREISLFVLYRIINSQEGIAHIQKRVNDRYFYHSSISTKHSGELHSS